MDMEEEYQSIFLYISEKRYPTIQIDRRNNFRRKCKNYQIRNNKLYFNHKKHKFVKVVQNKIRMDEILTETHMKDGAHLGINKMRNIICPKFYWKSIQADVSNYVKDCSYCKKKFGQRNENVKLSQTVEIMCRELKKSKSNSTSAVPVHKTTEFKYCYLDIIEPLIQTHSGYKYVAVLTDKSTKWADIKLLRKVETDVIGDFIYENTFKYGYPINLTVSRSCIEKEQGFQAGIIHKLQTFLQEHLFKVSIDIQTLIYNETFDNLLQRFISELPRLELDWDLHIHKILLSYNSFPLTEESPYYKTYKQIYSQNGLEQHNIWEWTLKNCQDFKTSINSVSDFSMINKFSKERA